MSFTVTFNTEYGTISPYTAVSSGSLIERPEDPVEAGKVLSFWYLDEEFTQAWDFDTDEVNENITLYARWVDEDTVTEYFFAGWYKDNETFQSGWDFVNDVITEETYLYARWIADPSVVMFNSNGGTLISAMEVPVGELVPRPINPTRTGYTFIDWYRDEEFTILYDFSQPKQDDLILHAKWELNVYDVTFVSAGSPVDVQIIEHFATVTKPTDPTLEGHTFNNWYTDEEFNNIFDFSTIITNHITLYGKFDINVYTVNFDVDGGSIVDPIFANHGSTIIEPVQPVKTGYNFVSWCKDEELNNLWDFNSDIITSDTTIYAKWIKRIFKVHFVSNGGTKIPEQDIEFEGKVVEPEKPIKKRFAFYD